MLVRPLGAERMERVKTAAPAADDAAAASRGLADAPTADSQMLQREVASIMR